MKIQVHNKTNTIPLRKNNITELTSWLCNEIDLSIESLDIIFTSDENLRDLHKDFLNDATYTDIITFNLGTSESVEGEIYISSERAFDNAQKYKVPREHEIIRLIIHGCLHLAGYEDNNDVNRQQMKEKEDYFLSMALKLFLN